MGVGWVSGGGGVRDGQGLQGMLAKSLANCFLWPGGQKNGQPGGRDFFFPDFNFLKLECTGGKVKKKKVKN